MRLKLHAVINHKSFPEPMHKDYFYQGDTIDDIVEQIETLPCHRHNLRHHRKCSFKDVHGIKHTWTLTPAEEVS